MEQNKPGRAYRKRNELADLKLKTFKDLLDKRVNFVYPQTYDQMTIEQKQKVWMGQLQKLKTQKEKICFIFPDSKSEEQINFGIGILQKYNEDNILDYQYQSMFLGKKKQLLIYLKCTPMQQYLQWYKLPNSYESCIKEMQEVNQKIFQKQIQRNIYISLLQKQKVANLTKQIQPLLKKFEERYTKFEKLMQQILEDFNKQKNRTVINLTAIRQSIYLKLKNLEDKYQVYIHPRFPDIENDQYLDVEIKKKDELDINFDNQINKIKQQDGSDEGQDDDKSSVVSDLSEGQKKKLFLQKVKSNTVKCSPVGIYDVKFQKYVDKTLTLKISLQFPRNKQLYPQFLQYGQQVDKLDKQFQIQDPKKDFLLEILFQKGNYVNYFFRTKSQFGFSPVKNFKYLLKVDKDNQPLKNGKLLVYGNSSHLIPNIKTVKEEDFHIINFPLIDLSVSSTQFLICDTTGNSADWGLFKTISQNKKQIQSNQYFSIVDNGGDTLQQDPALRLQRRQILKVQSGSFYGLLLDSFGKLWSYGKNSCGQLGKKGDKIQEQAQEIKFFKQNQIFIVDIKASQCSASFAIDSNGTLYKWGANQFLSTNYPILDRFGSVINYSTENQLCQQWTPVPVKKNFQTQKIVQIQCGYWFYFMLNNEGTLYGWGQCRNLGKGVLKDGTEQQIQNICNPIEIMKNVWTVSSGKDHAIAMKTNGKVFGWGNLKYISNKTIEKQKQFTYQPVDISQEYGNLTTDDIITCGPTYTCIYKRKQGKVYLFGQTKAFEKKELEFKNNILKIECEQKIIAFLVDATKISI